MGCAVACVAFILKTSYDDAKRAFKHPEYAWQRGYYCREICEALRSRGKEYTCSRYSPEKRRLLYRPYIIVFIAKSKKHPFGHFLVRTKNGWMNPWINIPSMVPAKSGFQKRLPGRIQWVLYATR